MKSPDELQSELFRICQGGEADDARALLQMGASVNCADEWDMTPLMYTCAYGRVTLAQLLLEHGADIALRDKLGRNARDVAMEMGETDIVEMIEVEMGRMFPDVNRVTKGSIHIERAEAIGPNVDSPGCESGSELEDDAAVVKEQLVAIVTAHEESLRREAAGESGETAGPQAAAEATATTSEKAVRGAAAGHGHGQHGSVHGQNTSMRDGHARACGEPRPCIQCGTVVQQEESLPAGVSSPHKYCYNCGGPLLQCVVPKFCHECGARVNIGP